MDATVVPAAGQQASGIDRAIETAGTLRALAERLGVTREAVSQWRARGVVPPARVLDVERITGVHRHFLNPSIYPDRPDQAA
jgi:DNA-binding transcriptional regulator YdaS (Cro superfamily)